MNRTNLQRLAEERIEDARVLLGAGRWSAAYYLAGYSLECAIKSCILAYIEQTGAIFRDRKYAESCWTHDLTTLLQQAELQTTLDKAGLSQPRLATNWQTVCSWSEASRYNHRTQADAVGLIDAITDPNDGVLLWLKNSW